MIWLGILVGTDFNEKFPRVGPKTAIKLVQEFNTFEEIVEKIKRAKEHIPQETTLHTNIVTTHGIE